MADPVCGLIISAAAAGIIDYATFDGSRRFYIREYLLLGAYANTLKAKSSTLRALHRSASPTEDSAKAANDALHSLMPWVFDAPADMQATFDDMMVAWYRAMGNFPQAA
jgi:hypothetical protein